MEIHFGMTGKYWRCNRTRPKRYHCLGATGYALHHVRCKDAATVIDVGCSTGVAMLECKKCIAQHGIRIRAIGIDMSEKVVVSAENNLDEFIPKNVLDVTTHKEDADVVMCLNVIRFVGWDVRSEIIRKCAWFLSEKGVLITGVDKKHEENIVLEQSRDTIPDSVCGEDSFVTKLKNLCMPDPKDTRMMRRGEALKYADMLRNEWQNMNRWKKMCIKIDIWLMHN